jgi:hypothetical protein
MFGRAPDVLPAQPQVVFDLDDADDSVASSAAQPMVYHVLRPATWCGLNASPNLADQLKLQLCYRLDLPRNAPGSEKSVLFSILSRFIDAVAANPLLMEDSGVVALGEHTLAMLRLACDFSAVRQPHQRDLMAQELEQEKERDAYVDVRTRVEKNFEKAAPRSSGSGTRCNKCNKRGHFARDCRSGKPPGNGQGGADRPKSQ